MGDVDKLSTLVEVILSGGIGYVIKSAWDMYARSREAKTPEARIAAQLTQTNSQVDLLARVNKELESDNDRLRSILIATEDRAQKAREAWDVERQSLISELDDMRSKLLELMTEVDTLQSKIREITTQHGVS